MSSRLVREAATYSHIQVANALESIGYVFINPSRRSTNVRAFLGALPKHVIEQLIVVLRKGGE